MNPAELNVVQFEKSSKRSHQGARFAVKLLITLISTAWTTLACLGGAATPSAPGPPAEIAPSALTPTAPPECRQVLVLCTPGAAPIRPTLPTLASTSGVTRETKAAPSPQPTQRAATATPAEGRMEITVGDYYFYPQIVTVTVGTEVRWLSVGVLYHTIMSKDSPPVFSGTTGGAGTRPFKFTFRKPGVYAYHCDYHPGAMDAWVMVVEDD